MVQRGAGPAAGEDAPATHARRRTARPAGSEAQHLGLTARPRITARRDPLEGTARLRRQQPIGLRGAQHARDMPQRCPAASKAEVSRRRRRLGRLRVSRVDLLRAATFAGCWSSIIAAGAP